MPAAADGDPQTPGQQAERSTTILVEDVHIDYRIYSDSHRTLRDVLARKGARDFRLVQAVRGIDREVHTREQIDIIGADGSAKTTLLRAIAGLLPVNKGRVLVRAEPTLLDVGSDLKYNMSGARNIYVGCPALGMTREQVDDRFDDMVAFAGLEDSIDLPRRTNSSGMRARLSFSIASAVTPEILLIDEAPAVGDRSFREKILKRVHQLVDAANTVVMVAHSLGDVRSTCSRAIWLDCGCIQIDGAPDEVIAAYAGASG